MWRAAVLVVTLAAGVGGCGASLAAHDAAPNDGNGGGEPCLLEFPAMKVAGTSCQYSVPDPPSCEITTRAHISVRIDGTDVPALDAANGWSYTDASMTAIELHGQACNLANGSSTGVIIEFHIITV